VSPEPPGRMRNAVLIFELSCCARAYTQLTGCVDLIRGNLRRDPLCRPLGLFIPIALYSLVSFADRDLRTHSRLSHFLWAIAIPYLWPSAAALLPATANNLGDSIVFWTMSLVLNMVIYAVVGFALSRLSRIACGPGTKSK
jgi:hypothetical protein